MSDPQPDPLDLAGIRAFSPPTSTHATVASGGRARAGVVVRDQAQAEATRPGAGQVRAGRGGSETDALAVHEPMSIGCSHGAEGGGA